MKSLIRSLVGAVLVMVLILSPVFVPKASAVVRFDTMDIAEMWAQHQGRMDYLCGPFVLNCWYDESFGYWLPITVDSSTIYANYKTAFDTWRYDYCFSRWMPATEGFMAGYVWAWNAQIQDWDWVYDGDYHLYYNCLDVIPSNWSDTHWQIHFID